VWFIKINVHNFTFFLLTLKLETNVKIHVIIVARSVLRRRRARGTEAGRSVAEDKRKKNPVNNPSESRKEPMLNCLLMSR